MKNRSPLTDAEHKARTVVITHLRRMASGLSPYEDLADVAVMTRSIWLSASDFIEDDDKCRSGKNACCCAHAVL